MITLLEQAGYSFNKELKIWSLPCYEGINYSDGDEVEQRIETIIAQSEDVSLHSQELLQSCNDWPSLYHLSKIRTNILRPFDHLLQGADVLEIGAGCGAITRYLGECGANVLALEGSLKRAAITRARTRDLENVTLLAENFNQLPSFHRFDIITLIGVLEYANLFMEGENRPLAMLQHARSLLKPHGKLIIAIENQLGLKYFAGAPEDHIGKKMYGIEGRYKNNHQPETFGRTVLKNMLDDAGLTYQEWLAPFPDYKFPISIITQQGMINENFDASALAWQSVKNDPQLSFDTNFSLELVWPQIIKNQLGLELSNSFLIIASPTGDKVLDESILAYHYSTGRAQPYCKSTIFRHITDEYILIEHEGNSETKNNPVEKKDELIKFTLPQPTKYTLGEPLSWELIKILTQEECSFSDIAHFIKRYLLLLSELLYSENIEISEFSPYTIIPGFFLDAIPQNIILTKTGSAIFIDNEWSLNEPLELGYLLFRLLYTIPEHTRRAFISMEGQEFIYSALEAFTPGLLTHSDYQRYFELEQKFQNIVASCVKKPLLSWDITSEDSNASKKKHETEIQVKGELKNLVKVEQKTMLSQEKLKDQTDRYYFEVIAKEEKIRDLEKIVLNKNNKITELQKNKIINFISNINSKIVFFEIAWSGLFDKKWYLEQNPDVALNKENPILHYIYFGAQEERDPHPNFNTKWYLDNNPDVAQSSLNPLYHYIKFGKKEGRKLSGALIKKTINISDCLPSKYRDPNFDLNIKVSVIIPVYLGYKETRKCIESVVKNSGKLLNEIIVINDFSRDKNIEEYLNGLSYQKKIRLINNKKNEGFIASVNIGIKAAGEDDVVILNSDTEVPPNWLKRLAGHAYLSEKTGTVTPFSNDATICSWLSTDGTKMPEELSLHEVDDAFFSTNNGRQILIPTAVGFCMYIKRDCLKQVGLLDEVLFGKGYGEENDFCMRATNLGWNHILACDTFVFHQGSLSFGKESPYKINALKILTTKYPEYNNLIRKHILENKAVGARIAPIAHLIKKTKKTKALIVTHSWGGGTQRNVDEIIKKGQQDFVYVVLTNKENEVTITIHIWNLKISVGFTHYSEDELVKFLQSFGLNIIHIHHSIDLNINLKNIVRRLNIPFDFTVHDYYTICPKINLVEDEMYCGEFSIGQCNNCIKKNSKKYKTNIQTWRRNNSWMIKNAKNVFCPSFDVLNRISRYYKKANYIIKPHDEFYLDNNFKYTKKIKKNKILRVGLIGAIPSLKGRNILVSVADKLSINEYKFIVIGFCSPPIPKELSIVEETGKYHDNDLKILIDKSDLDVVWFPALWPETYSYTLSAAIEARLPIIATKSGAFIERLQHRPYSWLVELSNNQDAWIDCLKLVRAQIIIN